MIRQQYTKEAVGKAPASWLPTVLSIATLLLGHGFACFLRAGAKLCPCFWSYSSQVHGQSQT